MFELFRQVNLSVTTVDVSCTSSCTRTQYRAVGPGAPPLSPMLGKNETEKLFARGSQAAICSLQLATEQRTRHLATPSSFPVRRQTSIQSSIPNPALRPK